MRLRRLARLSLAPDGRPRPEAPFGQGPLAARVLRGAILGASAVVSRAPVSIVGPLTTIGATIEWACRPAKRRRLASNLCHVVALPPDHADVKTLLRKEVRNEARRSADFLWALARPGELLETTEVEGRAHLHEASTEGAGHCSTHIGGWEVAMSLVPHIVPLPTTAIVTDDWLACAVEGLRIRAGLGIMYDSESAANAVTRLRRGEALLVLGDYAKEGMRTYAVRFLDAVAELPAGHAVLARVCGAPVVPFSVLPLARRRWRIEVEPPLYAPDRNGGVEVEKVLLQKLADRWTVTLRAHPEHWAAVYPMTWRGR